MFDLFVVVSVFAKTKRIADSLIFFIIPLMHVSYGAGEWYELCSPNHDLSKMEVPTQESEVRIQKSE